MGAVFVDTETTGKPYLNADLAAPYQPDVIQLAFLVDDDYGNEVATANFLVKPRKSARVETGAYDVHGISSDDAEKWGVRPNHALALLFRYLVTAPVFVAHNVSFDLSMIYVMANRTGMEMPDFETFCTMHNSVEKCRLPGRKNSYKWPKLDEAYRILVNPSGFSGAHDALADVRACRSLYYQL